MTTTLRFLTISFLVFMSYLELTEAYTPIRRCENKNPLPLMVQIENCNDLPCNIYKGTTSHMAIQFVASKNSMMNIRALVKLTTLGNEVPFELIEQRSDVCKNLMFDAYCPLDAGEDVTYHLMLTISDNQVELPVKIEVSLVDQTDGEILSCFVTDGRIKKPMLSNNE